jgi:hypothetical protein
MGDNEMLCPENNIEVIKKETQQSGGERARAKWIRVSIIDNGKWI